MAGNAFGQEPEIEVFQGGATLTSGQGSVIAFDATVRGSPTGRSFTVLNAGGGSLSITGITVPTGYSVVGVPSSIGPGLSATFDVQFDALQTGTFGGNVIIASSDADEG
ncbi:MAG: choice-of-anchor D domain-containing protein, partial [Verrucomicrobiales bacterium]|nr:choice-of-anchor D domain-containing protein [Verrucomicrobiales bacterium]